MNYPWLRRFWLRSPNKGEMVIMDHSWYFHVLDERIDKAVSTAECRKAFTDIVEFERMLAADGCVFVKFWFHISKDEQKRRFRAIEKDPLEAWQVTAKDWKRHEQYEAYLDAAEQMLEMTESGFAPWTIIEATSKWWARKKVFEVAISALETALGDKAPPVYVDPKPKTKKSAAQQTAEPAKAGQQAPPESEAAAKPAKPKKDKSKKDKPKKEESKKDKDKKIKAGKVKDKQGKAKTVKSKKAPPVGKPAKPSKPALKTVKKKGAKQAAKAVKQAAPKPVKTAAPKTEKKGGKTNA
jgi:hypothetical protein